MKKTIDHRSILMLALVMALGFSSCEKADSPGGGGRCNWEKEYADFNAKADAYIADPYSVSKCGALRQSSIALVERLQGCTGVQELQNAANLWRSIDCSDLN